MSTLTGWKCTTQVKLIAELQGFWAEDLWDMHHSPAGSLSPNASQRRLKFDCKSPAINGELKYVCWKKFSEGQWRSTQELTKVHLMIRWLNSLDDLPASLICLSFPEWQALYRKYLLDLGMYKQGTTNRMNGKQQPTITARDSCYMSLLRQASIMLKGAYDLRPPHEKDVWDLERMGGPKNLSRTNVRLGFLIVRQCWLRRAAKLYLKFCLPLYAAGTCRTRVQAIACFSDFLAEVKPYARAKDITRKLLLNYLNYLQKRVRTGSARNNVLNLRNFLEMSHREGWLPVGPERLVYDEEVPQPPKPQPRYLPSAVLDQLNLRLGNLSTPWQRMILILQECGMRISELLELPVDCLTQDARGVHYLRYLQGKVRRENAIPISPVIAGIVQEQQLVATSRSNVERVSGDLKKSQASLHDAELNLGYTNIVAPVSGVVGRKQIEAGQRVAAGQLLLNIVPTDDLWVIANFKETQLRHMTVGSNANVHVDAYGMTLSGKVESIGGATGSKYALLAPENATGNYVKVVQRIPVRIRISVPFNRQHPLLPGMSVEAAVQLAN